MPFICMTYDCKFCEIDNDMVGSLEEFVANELIRSFESLDHKFLKYEVILFEFRKLLWLTIFFNNKKLT